MQTVIIILGVIVVIFIVITVVMAEKIKNATQDSSSEEISNTSKIEYPYHRKYLLSTNEYKFYKDLKLVTDK